MEDFSLSDAQVREKQLANMTNEFTLQSRKSAKDIILSNIFTLFNIINLVLALFVVFTGQYKNMLFLTVIVINTMIGIYQEIKAKRILDKLSLLAVSKIRVIRNNIEVEILPQEVLLGEYIVVKSGDQIICDGTLVSGHIECDESLLTGESDMIDKMIEAKLLSGSFVSSGYGIMRADKVGADSYINKLASQAKVFKVHPSELRDSLNFILKLASFLIGPIGLALFIKGYYFNHHPLNDVILGIVAALVGMIAEGLILLTSVSLAVSSINLARKRILVQELFCIETLARVDTLCFDKTGTLTTGNMKVVDILGRAEAKDVLGDYVRVFKDKNQTSLAIERYTEDVGHRKATQVLEFSSAKKYSAVSFEGEGTYILGAFEYIFPQKSIADFPDIIKATEDAKRVVVLAHSKEDIKESKIAGEIELVATVILEDEIRRSTIEIFEYFQNQDVDIKIISGDNHLSVLEIAKRAGLSDKGKAIDVSKLSDEELKKAVLDYQVFGRVNPTQKKLMVTTLKEAGHKVAMSGDGVNDVLALKEANISIAMANGSAAAKQISNIVLLDGDFSNFYAILMEGRRVINNIQKVASLFLVKTFYSAAIAILTLFTHLAYPFIPIQLTMISSLTVGLPAFIITFERSRERIKDNFIQVVFLKSGISALRLVMAVIVINLLGFDGKYAGNMIVLLTLLNGILMLYSVLHPFNRYKTVLFAFVIAGSALSVSIFKDFFAIMEIYIYDYFLVVILMTGIYFAAELILYLVKKLYKRMWKKELEV